MRSGIWSFALLTAISLVSQVFALSITSQPVLIAFAKRSADHPYSYQITTDAAGGETVVYSLDIAPQGMAISATGLISWDPEHWQAYDNAVTVKAAVGLDEATQSFNVFVLGLTPETVDALTMVNYAWCQNYTPMTPGTERPNYHMLMYIGDSQSMATNWGSAILGACTWYNSTFPHYPRFWGAYQSNEPVCQEVTNGNNGQSAMRSSGHSSEYGNLSSQQASWGMGIVRTAVTNTCVIGAATATVAFGHNDAAAGKDAPTFVTQMSAICDSLLSFNIMPIVFTVSPGVEGGSWGSTTALALYPEYRDSIVAMCTRRNLPCIDVFSAVQTALNTGAAPTLASMYNDAVHYKYDGTATVMNPLHIQSAALNIVNHMLAHMMGYLYESGAHAPVLDTYASGSYPSGLPLDNYRSSSYRTDYTKAEEPAPVAVVNESGISNAPNPFNPSTEISCTIANLKHGTPVTVAIHDISGKLVKNLYAGTISGAVSSFKLAWDGRGANNAAVAAGMYIATMRAGAKTYSAKLLLAK